MRLTVNKTKWTLGFLLINDVPEVSKLGNGLVKDVKVCSYESCCQVSVNTEAQFL